MNKIKNFVDKNKSAPGTEGELARAYLEAVDDRDSANRDLMKTVRYEKFGNKLLPYFLPEYEKPLIAEAVAKCRIAEIEADIKKLLETKKDSKKTQKSIYASLAGDLLTCG
jgi:hypothetical protein